MRYCFLILFSTEISYNVVCCFYFSFIYIFIFFKLNAQLVVWTTQPSTSSSRKKNNNKNKNKNWKRFMSFMTFYKFSPPTPTFPTPCLLVIISFDFPLFVRFLVGWEMKCYKKINSKLIFFFIALFYLSLLLMKGNKGKYKILYFSFQFEFDSFMIYCNGIWNLLLPSVLLFVSSTSSRKF